MTTERPARPVYKGMTSYIDPAGFNIWVPDDWHKIELKDDHEGVLFVPDPDDIDTGFLAERHRLGLRVRESDMPAFRDSFMEGVEALDGVEIEEGSFDEFITHRLSFFQVRFTFLEGEHRRKRWIKNIYWGRNNYVLIAQGRTPEEYDYWQPMFYQIMITAKI